MNDDNGRPGLCVQGAEAAVGDRYRLDRLAESLVTPWQLPPQGPQTVDPEPHPVIAHAALVDSNFVVAWQLQPEDSQSTALQPCAEDHVRARRRARRQHE